MVNELMKVMGNRPNAQLLNYWIANSGPDLDWYIGTAEHELLTSDHDVPTDPETVSYTHLDVYKRQPSMRCDPRLGRKSTLFVENGR